MEDMLSYFELSKTTKSINRYSPVFKTQYADNDVIIKKTKTNNDDLNKLLEWTKVLEQNGVSVVRPVVYKNCLYKNVSGDNWIVYPFIKGHEYAGGLKDIYLAGELLGKIHLIGETTKTFSHGFHWEKYDDEFFNDVISDLHSLRNNYQDSPNATEFRNLASQIEKAVGLKLDYLRELNLPMVDGTWDFKASNLIFDNARVTLIDPDNAAYIPRIFDFALALILFQMDSEAAPARMFNEQEWTEFKRGYFSNITFTELEVRVWNEYLLFVYMDEALWAMTNLESDETERQKKFIESLLAFNPQQFEL